MKNDDVQLIRNILAGDENAFVSLVEKYQKQVHALAWRKIGDFHIAEEITQDTFLKVYQKLPTLRNPHHFSGWLYVIANRQCLAWLRKKRIETQSLDDTDSEWIEEDSYSRYVTEEHAKVTTETQQEIVKKLLAKLKESERTVLTLHYFAEMTVEEISRFLGVSTSAIKLRLYRARQRLQKEEPMIREALSNFQLSPNLTENIMKKVQRIKPGAPTGSKPFIPWAIGASTTLLILLILGMGSRHLARYQQPYSLDAQSEMTVELIEAPIVLNLDAEPDVRNQSRNQSDVPGKGDGTEQGSNQVLSDKGNYTQWNLPEGAKARLSKGSINDISFSPDGTQIAAASATGIWIYDARKGTELTLLTDHVSRSDRLVFSPDGKLLGTGMRENILLWDISSRKLLKSFNGFDKRLVSIRFFEDSKTLLCVYHDGTACLWDVTTDVKKDLLDSSSEVIGGSLLSLRGLAVSEGDIYLDKNHNGIFAIGYDNGEIRLEDVTTRQHLRTLQGGNNLVIEVVISPDGAHLVAYIPDEPLQLWEVTTGQLLKTFPQYNFRNNRTRMFTKDGKTLVFQTKSGEIELWDVATKTLRSTLSRKLDSIINVLAFSPDSKTIAGSTGDGKIHIWDVNTGGEISSFSTGHARGLGALVFSPDSKTLASGHGKTIMFWDTLNFTPLPTRIDTKSGYSTFAYSADGSTVNITNNFRFISETRDAFVKQKVLGSLSVWDTHSGGKISDFRIETHKGELPPGQKRAGYSDGELDDVTVFSQNGYMLATVINKENAIVDSRFTVILWEVPDSKFHLSLKGHTDKINALAFTPNGHLLASGSDDGTIRIWDASTGTEILSLPSNNTRDLTFSSDGKILASRSKDGTIYLWDIATSEELSSMKGYKNSSTVLAISTDSKILAIGNPDGAIQLWDISTSNKLSTLNGHTFPFRSLSFSPDGKTLASGSSDGAIFLWNLPEIERFLF